MSSKTKTAATKKGRKSALVPKLRFPEFRDAEEWNKAALGDLLEITSSKRVHESDWTGHGVPFYRAREIVALNKGEPITPLFISEELYRENARKTGEIVPGDLLVSGVGSIGVPYLVKPKDRFYFKDGNIIWLKNRGSKLQGQFLLILYGTEFVQSQIKTMAGVGTVGTYTIDNANKTFVVFPADDIEQQKIAECLSSVDELIAAQARKVDSLKTHKEGLMQQLFPREGETQPRFRFPEFQDSGEWIVEPLHKLANYENGKAYEKDIAEDGKFVVVNSRFISTDGAVRKYTNADYLIAKAGEVLMVLSDLPKGKALAKCYFVDVNDRYAVNQRVCRLKPGRIDGRFLCYILNRHPHLMAFDDGMNQTHLSKGSVVECPLSVPLRKDEQQRIAECLSSVDKMIAAQTQKFAALKTYKKGLMQQLFPSAKEVEA